MTREELEARSKSELIDLALDQQARLEEMQFQLAQLQLLTRKNGAEQDLSASTLPPGAGEFPRAMRFILIAGAALLCGILAIVAAFRPSANIDLGRAIDYPPGSVTTAQVPDPDRSGQAIPIFVVHDAEYLVLYARDPDSNCLLHWNEAAQRIEDMCSGSTYSRTGDPLEGPATRGLERFSVTLTSGGDLQADLRIRQPGPPQP